MRSDRIVVLEMSDDGQTWVAAHPACAYWTGDAIKALKATRGFSQHRIVLRAAAMPYAPVWGRA